MQNVLIIDTETTGIDPSKGSLLIEVAAVLYNIPNNIILQQVSTLFPAADNPVEGINGIPAEATLVKMPRLLFVPMLAQMAEHSRAIVAHNASFDKKFLATLDPQPGFHFQQLPWVCTKNDFQWPVMLTRKRLQDVCKAMDVPYEGAHRALGDCHLIAKCFDQLFDLDRRIAAAIGNNFQNGSRFI
jgi:DNA polymerase-3 subunit epsilon